MNHRNHLPPVLVAVLVITIPLKTQVAAHSEAGEDVRSTSGGQEPCSNFEATFELADMDGGNGFAIEGAGSFSAAGAGDINADGYNDFLIGNPNAVHGFVYVIFGGADVGTGGLIEAADLDGDGEVRVPDLIILLAAWGPNPGHPADFDGDGLVNVPDLIILLGSWGDQSSPTCAQ